MKRYEKITSGEAGLAWRWYGSILNEEGVALITTFLILVLLALLAPVIVKRTAQDTRQAEKFKESRAAFYIAEAGMEQAKALLKAQSFNSVLAGPDGNPATVNDNGTFTITGGSIVTVGGSQYTQVAFNGGAYSVRFYNNNDGGTATNDVDGVGYIQSIGVYKNSTKTLLAMVGKPAGNLSNLPAAMTMVGGLPHAQVSGQGSGFLVTGNAVDLNGNPDITCGNKSGIATSDPSPSLQWGGNAQNRVQGVGGTPSILPNENLFTLAQAQALYAQVVNSSVNIGSGDFTGNQTWGTDGAPRVTHITGDGHIKGNISGSGILLIDGNAELTGNFTFHGLVLIGVQPGATQAQLSGTGSGTVIGGLVMGNTTQSQAQLTGSGTIEYSCAGLNLAANLAGANNLSVISWNEVS